MNEFGHEQSQHFDDNVRRVAGSHVHDDGPGARVLEACEQMLAGDVSSQTLRRSFFRRPTILSFCGIAASIAVVVGLIVPWGGVSSVSAADILAQFDAKVAGARVVELVFDNIVWGGNAVEGSIYLSEDVVAGDFHVHAPGGGDDGVFTIDASVAFQPSGGWVLVRELSIADPQMALMASMFVASKGKTLLMFPNTGADNGRFISTIDVGGPEIIETIRQFVREQSDTGVTIEPQEDGTVLMTLAIESNDAVRSLGKAVNGALGGGVAPPMGVNVETRTTLTIGFSGGTDEEATLITGIEPGEYVVEESRLVSDEDSRGGDDFLVGSTLHILYDPDGSEVLLMELVDLGDEKGVLAMDFRDGEIDPDMLDVEKVKGPNTRVLDMSQFSSMFNFSTAVESGQSTVDGE